MTKEQARIILCALVHDGLDVGKLTKTAKSEIREAVDAVLDAVDATKVSDHGCQPDRHDWKGNAMTDNICECPKCGRQHRDLGFGQPPKSIMEQIADDIRDGAFPKKSTPKRPVAFRVPRVIDDKLSDTEFRLFADEAEARTEAEALGCDYQGLYVRDGT